MPNPNKLPITSFSPNHNNYNPHTINKNKYPNTVSVILVAPEGVVTGHEFHENKIYRGREGAYANTAIQRAPVIRCGCRCGGR